jgi:hypothetical protein
MSEPIRFLANRDFFCPVMNSAYSSGMRYTLTPENAKLAAQLEKWLGLGYVQLCKGPAAKVHGRGF